MRIRNIHVNISHVGMLTIPLLTSTRKLLIRDRVVLMFCCQNFVNSEVIIFKVIRDQRKFIFCTARVGGGDVF